jgi:ArsR family metal-binding transcriptional regulator
VSWMEFTAIKPCRFDAYEAVPKGRLSLDLDECEKSLAQKGYEVISNAGVMLVLKKGVEITLYPHGRLLLHPVGEREEALRIARELYDALGR